jgi:hypothetical protein
MLFILTDQGEQKIKKKNLEIFQKVAQKVSMAKNAKISTTKLNLNAQNFYIKALLKPKIPTTNHVLKLLI